MLEVVSPAFEDVAGALDKQGANTRILKEDDRVVLYVGHDDELDFVYKVRPQPYALPSFVENDEEDEGAERKYFRAEVHLSEGGQNYDIMGWSRQDVIEDVLDQYERHLHYLHLIRE